MWSLGNYLNFSVMFSLLTEFLPGMILYKMMFLKLPYEECDSYDVLRAQILSYMG